jgi:hypothetical protein
VLTDFDNSVNEMYLQKKQASSLIECNIFRHGSHKLTSYSKLLQETTGTEGQNFEWE